MTPDEQEAAEQAAWDRKHAARHWIPKPKRPRSTYKPAARRVRGRVQAAPPAAGEPGYSAHLAELSAELGSLDAAFQAVRR